MKKTAILAGLAATGLATAPVVAADRTAAPVEGEQELGGNNYILYALGAAAVIAAIIIIADDDDDDEPVSI